MVTSLAERVTFFDRMVTSRGAVLSSERGLGGFARCSVALRFSRAFCQLAALLHQPIAPPFLATNSRASRWTRYLVTCLLVTPRSEARAALFVYPEDRMRASNRISFR